MEISVEVKDPALYRGDWESSWGGKFGGGKFGSFEDYSNPLSTHLIRNSSVNL
jgi:hypothetical protein